MYALIWTYLLISELLTAGRVSLQAFRVGFLIPSLDLSLPCHPGPVTGKGLLLTPEGSCKSILRGPLPRPLLWADLVTDQLYKVATL